MTIPSEIDRLTRVHGADALASAQEWETATPAAVPALDVEEAQTAARRYVETLARLRRDAETLLVEATGAHAYWTDRGEPLPFVAAAEELRSIRADLASTLSLLEHAAGQAVRDRAMTSKGNLGDGRAYTIRRAADRKAWEHDAWKHDVAREVASGTEEAVNPATGESVNVVALIRAALDVPGATAPKTTALSDLGLSASDYCETVRGPWQVQVTGL